MSSENPADADYPYAYRPPAVLRPADFSSSPAQRSAGRFIWVSFLRFALATSVIVALIALPVGIVAYLARRQAALVEILEERGCQVGYSYERQKDGLPHFLEETFGQKYFGIIEEVNAVPLATPGDVVVVCNICGKLDQLKYFGIASDSFSFHQIADWKHLDQLGILTIRSPNLNDDDLARIGRMPELFSLELASPRITDAGLGQLSGLRKLETLIIESARLDGSGSANNSGFPKLNRLSILNSPRAGDQAIINLGPLPVLVWLDLSGTAIGDQAIAHAASGGKLVVAGLSRTKITDAAIESLSKCPQLSTLELTDTQITDAGVAHLATCRELTNLDVAGTKVTGKGFGALSGQELTLVMDRTDISDESLRDVAQIQGSTNLSLQETKITGSGVEFFGQSGALQSITLSGAALTRDGFEVLAKSRIPDLNINRTPIDDKLLMLFAANDDLTVFRIIETKVTDAGVRAFYEARKQRLAKTGRQEELYVACDFEGLPEAYLPDASYGGLITEGDAAPEPVEAEQPQPPSPAEKPAN